MQNFDILPGDSGKDLVASVTGSAIWRKDCCHGFSTGCHWKNEYQYLMEIVWMGEKEPCPCPSSQTSSSFLGRTTRLSFVPWSCVLQPNSTGHTSIGKMVGNCEKLCVLFQTSSDSLSGHWHISTIAPTSPYLSYRPQLYHYIHRAVYL